MNKEQYVSFKVAKLLKEKGFNWPCTHYYYDDGTMHEALNYVRQNDGEDDDNDECLCPTQQMSMCWLREEKGIHIYPIPVTGFNYVASIYTEQGNKRYDKILLRTGRHAYEDAVEAALGYALTNLI